MAKNKSNDDMLKMKPTMNLSEDELKAVKKWVVGKNYKLAVDVKQTDKHISEDNKFSAGFEILKVTPREARLSRLKEKAKEY